MKSALSQRCVAELFGTFVLVFAGTGAIVFDHFGSHITHVGVSMTFGLVVAILIYVLGPISGAHLNPAVTFGLTVAGQFPWRELPVYVMSQCFGAILASGLLYTMYPHSDPHFRYGATEPITLYLGSNGGPTIMVWQSFVLETILTLILLFTILRLGWSKPEVQQFSGMIIGAVIGLEALFAGPVCGASMNPARSLAPAIIAGRFEHLWIYLIAPPLGAILAIPLWKFLSRDSLGESHEPTSN
jgi:aquaporin NIP